MKTIFLFVLFCIFSNTILAEENVLGCQGDEVVPLGNINARCSDLQKAVKHFPIEKTDTGWRFVAEGKTKVEIEKTTRVPLPKNVIPMGYFQTELPGGDVILLVFDFNYFNFDDHGKAQAPRNPMSTRYGMLDSAANIIGLKGEKVKLTPIDSFYSDPGYFESVLFYRGKPGDSFVYNGTIQVSEGLQIGSDSFKSIGNKSSVLCAPCVGWLCRQDNFVCVTHFDDPKLPQFHFKSFGAPESDYLTSYQIRSDGKVDSILDTRPRPGTWIQTQKQGWFFEESSSGEGGGCTKYVKAYAYPGRDFTKDSIAGKYKLNQNFTDERFPYETKVLPPDCDIDLGPKGQFFWDLNDKLVKYVPRK